MLGAGGWNCPAEPGGTCSKDGTKVEFTLDLVLAELTEDSRRGRSGQGQGGGVGIKVDLSGKTEDAVNAQIYGTTSSKPGGQGKYEPTYDTFIWGWAATLPLPTTTSR